jgi:hypothetical protein
MYMPFAGNYDMLLSANDATFKKMSSAFRKYYQQMKKTVKQLAATRPLRWTEA